MTFMSDYQSYAQLNTLIITGRVSHAEVKQGKYGEFLSLTLLTELMNGTDAIAVEITSTNGLMTLCKNGHLTKGRRMTVTGHMESFSELYLNKETGKRAVRRRAMLKLGNAQCLPGGLGPAKRDETKVKSGAPELEEPPSLDPSDDIDF